MEDGGAAREDAAGAPRRCVRRQIARLGFTTEDRLAWYDHLVYNNMVKLAMFEPQRHSRLIGGRPVQATSLHLARACFFEPPARQSFAPCFVFITQDAQHSLSPVVALVASCQHIIVACTMISAIDFGQVMVLTYEGAPVDEQMPDYSTRLWPCRVIWFIGRAAKRDPPCDPAECLFHWFRDCHVVDTLADMAWHVACDRCSSNILYTCAVAIHDTLSLSPGSHEARVCPTNHWLLVWVEHTRPSRTGVCGAGLRSRIGSLSLRPGERCGQGCSTSNGNNRMAWGGIGRGQSENNSSMPPNGCVDGVDGCMVT